MSAQPLDDTRAALGEGPLWHPIREQFYWFDILGGKLHCRDGDTTRTVQFDEHVSAAGWIDDESLLIASQTRLFQFNVDLETRRDVHGLEDNNGITRSNDGRADPWGGFWIGTMGLSAENEAGAIYRYYRGHLRQLYPGVTIPNAICFSPDRQYAFYADTEMGCIMRQPLEHADGWPDGAPTLWLDLRAEGLHPDGAVVDAAGNLWNAQWGAWRVACYSPEAEFLRAVDVNAAHSSCPAFGGSDLTTLYCTSAADKISDADAARSDQHGCTFIAENIAKGQAEHQVIL